jgi:hypothetical protein
MSPRETSLAIIPLSVSKITLKDADEQAAFI